MNLRRSLRTALLLVALSGGLFAVAFPVISREVKRDSCADDGGIWMAASKRCECTYSQRGVYEDVPTADQLANRAECELKPKPTD